MMAVYITDAGRRMFTEAWCAWMATVLIAIYAGTAEVMADD